MAKYQLEVVIYDGYDGSHASDPQMRLIGAESVDWPISEVDRNRVRHAGDCGYQLVFFPEHEPIALNGRPIPDEWCIRSPDVTSNASVLILRKDIDLNDFEITVRETR